MTRLGMAYQQKGELAEFRSIMQGMGQGMGEAMGEMLKSFMGSFGNPALAPGVSFALLLGALALRPQGLFGAAR